MRLFLMLLLVCIKFNVVAQSALKIEKDWKAYEKTIKLSSYVKLSVVDKRDYQLNKLPLPALLSNITNAFEKESLNVIDDINDTLKNIIPVQLNVDVSYLNYTESTSGNVIVKGILNVTVGKGDFLTETKEVKISDDILISDFSLKRLMNNKNINLMNKAESDLNMSLAKQLSNEFKEILKTSGARIFEVIAFGKAVILNDNVSKAKNEAIANALIKASSNVFGRKIQSETTMVDMGNVTEVIKESINGNILQFEHLTGFNKQSNDHFQCVLIKAILKL